MRIRHLSRLNRLDPHSPQVRCRNILLFSAVFALTLAFLFAAPALHGGPNVKKGPSSSPLPSAPPPRPSETQHNAGNDTLQKPGAATVIFTFDDGPVSDYALAYPILQKYGIRGTSYIITKFTDAGIEGKLSWDQIEQMRKDGWVFGCHTYDHKRLTTMTSEQIAESMTLVNQSFQNQGLPAPTIMAYPYGAHDKRVIAAVQPFRVQARLAYYQTKFVDFAKPYEVNSISADMRTNSQLKLLEKTVDKAIAANAVVVFRIHALYREKPYDTVPRNTKILSGCAPQTDSRLFDEFVQYCAGKGCGFMTMEDLLEHMT